MKILLAGLGYVGAALAARLNDATPLAEAATSKGPATSNRAEKSKPAEIWGVSRNPDPDALPSVRLVRGDLSRGEGLHELPPDIDSICVAISPDERTEEAYRRAYPEIVSRLMGAFPTARILLVSSTAVYEQGGGAVIDDDSLAHPTSPLAQQIRRAEDLTLVPGTSNCVLRSSGIYGPGRTRLLTSLAHTPLNDTPGDVYTNRIHRDDLCSMLEFLLLRPTEGGIFLATDLHPSTPHEMATWLLSQRAARYLGLPPSGDLSTRERKSRKMTPRRFIELGYGFRYPSFREGYGAILDDLKALQTKTL